MGNYDQRAKVEIAEDWRGWVDKIPALQFDPEWRVKVIPPYKAKLVRFLVMRGDLSASVYLQAYDDFGEFDSPCWEVFPADGDAVRCAMDDTDELLSLIRQSLSPATQQETTNDR